jgi:rod shape-determining protein MreC
VRTRRARRIAGIAALILILILIAGITQPNEGGAAGAIGSFLSVPLSPFQALFAYFEKGIVSRYDYLADAAALAAENASLKERVAELERLEAEYDSLRFQNAELRSILNLRDRYRDMDMVGVNIIAWDSGNWSDLFTIDRGTADGVRIGSGHLNVRYVTAVTAAGLVGRVVQTTLTASKVQSIISAGSEVSGILTRSRQYVEVRGDLIHRDQGLCVIEGIQAEIDIEVGDTVETSGVGENYPKGVVIGRVEEISTDRESMTRTAVVRPAVDFSRLENVFILVSKND